LINKQSCDWGENTALKGMEMILPDHIERRGKWMGRCPSARARK
jgi:hypothetical protein